MSKCKRFGVRRSICVLREGVLGVLLAGDRGRGRVWPRRAVDTAAWRENRALQFQTIIGEVATVIEIENGNGGTTQLHLNGDFYDQLELLIHRVRTPREHIEQLTELQSDVQRVLKSQWPSVRLEPFGSVVAGLSQIGSDVDYHVYLPNSKISTIDRVLFAEQIIKRNPAIFSNIRTITNSPIPALGFYHNSSKTTCDLIFNDFAMEQETHLAKYLLRVDHRMYPLMMIIKFWAKVHKLTSARGFSNFTWLQLVTFYLQQVNILPPILTMQRSSEKEFVDGWNMAFKESFEDFYTSTNTDTVYRLLGGFFKFYSIFDFETNVISTFTGNSIRRVMFRNVEIVPNVYELYKHNVENNVTEPLNVNTPLCTQHFLVHHKNSARLVTNEQADRAIKHIREAADIFDKVSDKQFLGAILTCRRVELKL